MIKKYTNLWQILKEREYWHIDTYFDTMKTKDQNLGKAKFRSDSFLSSEWAANKLHL